jgi:hypothetical protein
MRSLSITIAVMIAMVWCQSAFPQTKETFTPRLSSEAGMQQWMLDGSGEWKVTDNMLRLWKAGVPAGLIRRPAALAILQATPLCDVTIEAQVRSTAPLDVVRRDLDVVLGYESPTRFYYVHIAGTSDSVHNGIFLVNNANRVRINKGLSTPHLTDTLWHHVRVERGGKTGRIAVYMDRMKLPVLEAVDTTIGCGRVGFGSFDDTGEFRHIIVRGSVR